MIHPQQCDEGENAENGSIIWKQTETLKLLSICCVRELITEHRKKFICMKTKNTSNFESLILQASNLVIYRILDILLVFQPSNLHIMTTGQWLWFKWSNGEKKERAVFNKTYTLDSDNSDNLKDDFHWRTIISILLNNLLFTVFNFNFVCITFQWSVWLTYRGNSKRLSKQCLTNPQLHFWCPLSWQSGLSHFLPASRSNIGIEAFNGFMTALEFLRNVWLRKHRTDELSSILHWIQRLLR